MITHFYKGQQVRKPENRTVQSVISKMIDVLSASYIKGKFREEISRIVKLLPEIVRKYAVLADPIYFRTKHPIFSTK